MLSDELQDDVAAIERIEAVPTVLEIVCRTTGMGFAAVARVTDDHWIACSVRDEIAFGLRPGGELAVETTICNEIRESREPVVINHVDEDHLYCGHPTPARYGFQSYISMPIMLRDGRFFGTLCAIDPAPAKLDSPETVGMFRLFADLIAFHLDAEERVAHSDETLLDERKTAELREQFIAVLGHDLRNPLASIESGLRLLGDEPGSDRTRRVLELMGGSVARMAGLIDNVLDLARGRLGGGLGVTREPIDLAATLTHVTDELRSSHAGRRIELALALPPLVDCDGPRIAQLTSNLVANALVHGSATDAVRVVATAAEGMLILAVSNAGAPIPAAAIPRLFHPFARGEVHPEEGGLGLGLYIASEIARSHGGTLTVRSDATETCFTLRMPLA